MILTPQVGGGSGGGVTSVSANDNSMTVSPTTGVVLIAVNRAAFVDNTVYSFFGV